MKIIISNYTNEPIYDQIKTQIKASILSGELVEGDILPSIRQLAKDLKISVITTTRAYNDLEQEGYIKSVQGKGFYVSPQNNELIRETALRNVEEGFMAAIAAARTIKIEKAELLQILDILLKEENYE